MHRFSSFVIVAALITLILVFSGCDRAAAPVNGLAGFELGKTMLADVPAQVR